MLKLSPFKIGCLLIFGACLIFHSFGREKPTLLKALDNRISDAMFRWRGPIPSTGEVVIVDIDEQSLRRMGQWPWPRDKVAELVRDIHAAGARVTGFDAVFAEPDRTSPVRALKSLEHVLNRTVLADALSRIENDPSVEHDLMLGRAVSESPVVLGYVFHQRDDGLKDPTLRPFPSATLRLVPDSLSYPDIPLFSSYRAILNVPEIAQAETEGFFNVFPDPSGTVRKVPLLMSMDTLPYPSLALEMLRVGLGIDEVFLHASSHASGLTHDLLGISLGDHFIPTDGRGQAVVNYRGPVGIFPYLSAVDVLDGRHGKELKGKFVLIGSSAAGLLDLRATPFSNIYPGVEIQATLIDNVLAGDLFRHDLLTEIGITYSLIVIGGLLLCALLAYCGPLLGGLGGLLVLLFTVWGNYRFFFLRQEMVGVTYPLLTLVILFMIVTLLNYFLEGRQRRFIRSAFSQYVSPQLVSRLEKNPGKVSLAGEQKDLTVFFTDIRNFTSIAEELEAENLAQLMNEILSLESDLIMINSGMVDKYIGDAVMAIWGAPLDDPDHPTHAVRAALQIMRKLLETRPLWKERGWPDIDIGIGINSGIMSVGNFGSRQRIEYTAIGDAVNLAARLEGSNKLYGTNILIAESTRAALGEKFFCRHVDIVRVKGKNRPVSIYEPLLEGSPEAELRREVEEFEEAVRHYRQGHFETAGSSMERLYRQHPLPLYGVYLRRIEAFRKSPPPGDWDGVYTFSHK